MYGQDVQQCREKRKREVRREPTAHYFASPFSFPSSLAPRRSPLIHRLSDGYANAAIIDSLFLGLFPLAPYGVVRYVPPVYFARLPPRLYHGCTHDPWAPAVISNLHLNLPFQSFMYSLDILTLLLDLL